MRTSVCLANTIFGSVTLNRFVLKLPTPFNIRHVSVNSGINAGLRRTRRWEGERQPDRRAPARSAVPRRLQGLEQRQRAVAERREEQLNKRQARERRRERQRFNQRPTPRRNAEQDHAQKPISRRDRRDTRTRRYSEREDLEETRLRTPVRSRNVTDGKESDKRSNRHNAAGHSWRSSIPVSIPYTTAASEFIAGLRSANAVLGADRRKFHRLHIADSLLQSTQDHLTSIARERRIPLSAWPLATITAWQKSLDARTADPNGVLLECSPLPQPPLTSLLESGAGELRVALGAQSAEDRIVNGSASRYALAGARRPLLLWLNGVTDVGNIGALYRSALYFGVDGVLLSTKATGGVHWGTHITSTGASEFLPTFRVSAPQEFIRRSQRMGWVFLAAAPPRSAAGGSAASTAPSVQGPDAGGLLSERPCVLTLGNEQTGLPPDLIKAMHGCITIPPRASLPDKSGVDSLNVSVAGALLMERLLRGDQGESPPLIQWSRKIAFWQFP